MKYDPILEETFYELIFEHYGFCPPKLPMKLAVRAHECYQCDEFGVEVVAEEDE